MESEYPDCDQDQLYKLEELKKHGFSEEQARILITVPDLQVADIREKFLKKGCTVDLVYRILA